jgi:hypothetical protein
VDGDWTAYNTSLDRSILKKEKYLAELPTPVNSVPHVELAVHTEPLPQPPPVATPIQKPAPQSSSPPPSSIFAEKLGEAWRKGS